MDKKLPSCPAQITLSFIDNKWKMLIIGEILEGAHRFSALKKALNGISQKVLTQNLRALEANGLIYREVFAEIPPRVEYSLTELGFSLKPVIDAMIKWGDEYRAGRGTITCPNCGEITKDEVSVYNDRLRKPTFDIAPIVPVCKRCDCDVAVSDICTGGNIIVLNGTCGSGKTTIAGILAERGFYVMDGDCVRRAVKHKTGRVSVDFQDQAVFDEVACELDVLSAFGDNFVLAHVLMPEDMYKYIEIFKARNLNYRFFLLKPDYQTALNRNQARTCHITPEEWVKHFYDALDFDDSVEVIDSTHMTAEQTADYILKK